MSFTLTEEWANKMDVVYVRSLRSEKGRKKTAPMQSWVAQTKGLPSRQENNIWRYSEECMFSQ